MKNEYNIDEKILLKQVSLGDKRAFRTIFVQYQGLVFSFAKRLTRSDVTSEEIVQEVFMKIWAKRESMTRIDDFGAYLNRVVRNHTYNVLRQLATRSRFSEQLEKKYHDLGHESDESVDWVALEELLTKAIDQLTPQQRKVYILCYQEGLRYQEVAEKLNISSLTVHTHMKIALKTIRSYLAARVNAIFLLVFALISKK